jgi:hypothetical protein
MGPKSAHEWLSGWSSWFEELQNCVVGEEPTTPDSSEDQEAELERRAREQDELETQEFEQWLQEKVQKWLS